MSLTAIAAIAGVAASYFNKEAEKPSVQKSSSNDLGFMTRGFQAYNTVRKDTEGNNPFQQSATIKPPASYGDRFSKPATAAAPPTGTAYSGHQNPDLQTAIANLVKNAQNSQMQQVLEEQRVNATIQQGRKTMGVGQPSLSSINVG